MCGQVFYFSTCIWPVNNEWICTLLWRKLQLFDVRARCRLLTKTAELCAPPLQLQKGEFFYWKKKWKNIIVRIFRRNNRIYNDFGWYYLCGFIVGFHCFWKNYTTNSEYTSSKVDLFVVWIRWGFFSLLGDVIFRTIVLSNILIFLGGNIRFCWYKSWFLSVNLEQRLKCIIWSQFICK